jgi:hypothetical protein
MLNLSSTVYTKPAASVILVVYAAAEDAQTPTRARMSSLERWLRMNNTHTRACKSCGGQTVNTPSLHTR